MITFDRQTVVLLSGVGGMLVVASGVGAVLKFTVRSESGKLTIANLNARIRAWWIMVAVFTIAIVLGPATSCVLFALISFLALREMITLAPTRRADHHTLFWAFFVIIPIQYYLVWSRWYGMFAIFIPVYCFLFLAIRSTLSGDYTRYIERAAKIQWGVMICVYCISHAPALLMLNLGPQVHAWKLLAFLVIVVQMSDVLQYVWGKLLGRHKIAPHLSPNKTWEGFVGGVISASLIGTSLYRITPFTLPQAAVISLMIAILGFFGGIVMSSIKRDAGVKDFGHLIEGHGGILDRVDSLCFAAPVFFHIVRYWFEVTT
jgi:phosphatidate cytidylyltransferase